MLQYCSNPKLNNTICYKCDNSTGNSQKSLILFYKLTKIFEIIYHGSMDRKKNQFYANLHPNHNNNNKKKRVILSIILASVMVQPQITNSIYIYSYKRPSRSKYVCTVYTNTHIFSSISIFLISTLVSD